MKTKTKKTRREPTEEQKAAAAERREQIKQLCAIVRAMPEEKRILLANSYGVRNCEGRELSPYNQCLLANQFAQVSIVGGFSQWKALGRSVKKGEKALAIWVPARKKGEDISTMPLIVPGTDPDQAGESFFVIGNVFDITQTETDEEKAIRQAAEAANADTFGLPSTKFIDVDTAPQYAPLQLA